VVYLQDAQNWTVLECLIHNGEAVGINCVEKEAVDTKDQ